MSSHSAHSAIHDGQQFAAPRRAEVDGGDSDGSERALDPPVLYRSHSDYFWDASPPPAPHIKGWPQVPPLAARGCSPAHPPPSYRPPLSSSSAAANTTTKPQQAPASPPKPERA